jgi:hypothetical protein
MMIHIVHAAQDKKYFVDAEDSGQAVRILNFVGIDTRGAIADPFQHEVRRGVRIYTIEDARIPLLGGKYILKLRDETGWVPVAEAYFGPLWTEIYQNAVKQYGEDE